MQQIYCAHFKPRVRTQLQCRYGTIPWNPKLYFISFLLSEDNREDHADVKALAYNKL